MVTFQKGVPAMMSMSYTMQMSSANCSFTAGTFVRMRIMDTALLAVSIFLIPLIALLGIMC